jgi:hypothetical protein
MSYFSNILSGLTYTIDNNPLQGSINEARRNLKAILNSTNSIAMAISSSRINRFANMNRTINKKIENLGEDETIVNNIIPLLEIVVKENGVSVKEFPAISAIIIEIEKRILKKEALTDTQKWVDVNINKVSRDILAEQDLTALLTEAESNGVTIDNAFVKDTLKVVSEKIEVQRSSVQSPSIHQTNTIPATISPLSSITDEIVNQTEYIGSLLSDTWGKIKNVGTEISNTAISVYNAVKDFIPTIPGHLVAAGNYIADAATSFYGSVLDYNESSSGGLFSYFAGLTSNPGVKLTLNAIASVLNKILPNYQDGVSESTFGTRMENSWKTFYRDAKSGTSKVTINETTPLSPIDNTAKSLYGNLMMGVPFSFTGATDPNNRTIINTFVKDSMFLSLTPGMPKYNGGGFQQTLYDAIGGSGGSIFNQTPDTDSMVEYVKKNGLDKYFSDKDKRYYVFEQKYGEYYAYLETMLNTLWVKMGLGVEGDGNINVFSFFNDDTTTNLKQEYFSSIGFFVNPLGAVSESISNSEFTSGLDSAANSASDTFQYLNYITGMGTAGGLRNTARRIAVAGEQLNTAKRIASENLSFEGNNILSRIANLGKSLVTFTATQDLSAVVQQFSVTNGMRVMYPNLWSSSNYMKNMNFSFNFTSPYGDPASIFQHVYVPFFSLLAFTIPRQADSNGFVSPFFVRADIPGVITSDLAFISDMTWTKGDESSWTKDKLPRSISGTFTISDLYPYLAATKRLSFLSANPSFTVFLDNMAGLRTIRSDSSEDPINEYWSRMLNRVGGIGQQGSWNVFGSDINSARRRHYRDVERKSLTKTINPKAVPWMSNN